MPTESQPAKPAVIAPGHTPASVTERISAAVRIERYSAQVQEGAGRHQRGPVARRTTSSSWSRTSRGARMAPILKQAYQGAHPFTQAPGEFEIFYSDYREVSGRLVPFERRTMIDGSEFAVSTAGSIEVDPEFDVFRRLHRNEIPPAVSQIMGAERVLIVLPAAAPAPLQAAYRALAEAWRPTRSARCRAASRRWSPARTSR